jgi:nonsense-mediated mRNA decay protein 3
MRQTFKDGMDFYFAEKQNAMRFLNFLENHVPTKTKYSRKLISADHKSNIGKFKHNFIIEIVPLCKDDLIIMPRALASNLSDFSPLALVKAVSAGVHIVDPFTGERHEIDTEKYWRYEFDAKMTSRNLVKFIVLAVEPMIIQARASAKKRGLDRKVRMAEITVVRERDFGVTDEQFRCVSHLGHIVREGDTVLGYDLASAAWTHEEGASDGIRTDLPDVILVRKVREIRFYCEYRCLIRIFSTGLSDERRTNVGIAATRGGRECGKGIDYSRDGGSGRRL